MERQIKFRGKNIHTGEWLYGDYHREGTTHYIAKPEQYLREYAPIEFIVDGKTVGQFTGLLDKNGKEIYDGDRVNVLQAERNFDIVVKWSNEAMAFMACYADGKQSPFSWFTNLRIYQLTVIGNIHNNPSLISDKR